MAYVLGPVCCTGKIQEEANKPSKKILYEIVPSVKGFAFEESAHLHTIHVLFFRHFQQ